MKKVRRSVGHGVPAFHKLWQRLCGSAVSNLCVKLPHE